MKEPIFFAWTRSFWSLVATIAFMSDAGILRDAVLGVMTIGGGLLGFDPTSATDTAMQIIPMLTAAYIVQQRSGAARPYTMDPRAIK